MTRVGRATAVLAFTQITGWGTTFYVPAIFGAQMGRDVGLPSELVYAGVTLCVVISGLLSPLLGPRLDRYGAPHFMAAGSVLMAVGLVLLSQAQGGAGYFAAWACLGLASTLCLSVPSFTAMAQVAGGRARSAMTVLMLFTGLSSSVFWPVTGALDHLYGWRTTCLIFAAVHLFACLPLHLFVLPRRAPTGSAEAEDAPKPAPPSVAPQGRRTAFLFMAGAFALSGFVSWGMSLHMVAVLAGAGLAPATALAFGSALGVLQVSARLADYAAGQRLTPATMALGSAVLLPLSFLALIAGLGSPIAALVFIVAYGFSTGLLALVRATLPLHVFGSASYGTYAGRFAFVQNVAYAFAPVVFAAVIDDFGVRGGVWLGLACATAALAFFALVRMQLRRNPAEPAALVADAAGSPRA